jgi:hypothetical protein
VTITFLFPGIGILLARYSLVARMAGPDALCTEVAEDAGTGDVKAADSPPTNNDRRPFDSGGGNLVL